MAEALRVLIAAAGRGSRMKAERNKPFLFLGSRPVLSWSLDFFEHSQMVDQIVVICREDEMDHCRRTVLEPGSYKKVCALIAGGAERMDSVWAGLQVLPAATRWVAVHDGARPLLSSAVLSALMAAAQEHGAAIPGLSGRDTLKLVDEHNMILETLPRERVYAVQTPQIFSYTNLIEAYQKARQAGIQATDDAALYERFIGPVKVVEGDARTRKLTHPEDMRILESLLPGPDRPGKVGCVGSGYDVHRLVPGRRLILGGVEIPYVKGLLGHSDADVLAHAIGDALLGAAALGDLGKHFPDDADKFKDIDSMVLLQAIRKLLTERGWEVHNVDSTIVAQAPKLAPYIESMRCRIAEALCIAAGRVSVKATTTEGLGFEGSGEGISAQAVVSIIPG